MGARDMGSWETSICDVVSTDEEEEVNIRGHRLSELIGQVSFAEAMFLLLQGCLPSTHCSHSKTTVSASMKPYSATCFAVSVRSPASPIGRR